MRISENWDLDLTLWMPLKHDHEIFVSFMYVHTLVFLCVCILFVPCFRSTHTFYWDHNQNKGEDTILIGFDFI